MVNNRGEAQAVTAMHYETVPALVRRLRLDGGPAVAREASQLEVAFA